MINENVTMALTDNTYSAYNMVSGFEMLIGAAVIFIGVMVYAVAPEHIRRLIFGYIVLPAIGVGLYVSYFVVRFLVGALPVVVDAVGESILAPLGRFVTEYFGYVVAASALAYYIGYKIDSMEDD